MPRLLIAVTPDGGVVLRSNVGPDVLRSFGEDLKNIADELEATPLAPDDTTHWRQWLPLKTTPPQSTRCQIAGALERSSNQGGGGG